MEWTVPMLAFEANDVLQKLIELSCCLPRLLFPPFDDFFGYESGLMLFTIVSYDRLELFLRSGVEEDGRRRRVISVHSHVERAVHSE